MECNQIGCHNRTEKFYGENDGQYGIDDFARKQGWRVSYTNGSATCPQCWQKEQERFLK